MNTHTFKLFVLVFALFGFAQISHATELSENQKTTSEMLVSPVNINSADAQTLADSLKGIGLKKAQAIVHYRETFGAFAAIEELADVKGIGESTVSKNSHLITLN